MQNKSVHMNTTEFAVNAPFILYGNFVFFAVFFFFPLGIQEHAPTAMLPCFDARRARAVCCVLRVACACAVLV